MALRSGYIGLGNIGKPMAGRWVRAGLETAVCDIAQAPVAEMPEAGAGGGVSVIDAAIGGGDQRAAAGELAIMVGGGDVAELLGAAKDVDALGL